MKNTILFLGDSFTWGEGLELYTDTPKWKNERFIKNTWNELRDKQDVEGIQFRESSRFPTIVGEALNCDIIVDKNNGGNLNSFIDLAEKNLYKPFNTIDTIIIQLSCLDREMYHLTPNCKCDVCINSEYKCIFPEMYTALEKIYKSEALTKTDLFILNFFEKKLNTSISDNSFFSKFNNFKKNWFIENLEMFNRNYVDKWASDGLRSIYFIDSWEVSTSEIVERVIDNSMNNMIISLIGNNNKLYKKWDEWEKTFTHKRIVSEFPDTKNHHPTLTQHKYIANSIIQFLNNKKSLTPNNKKSLI